MSDAFFGALKEKRDEAVAKIEELTKDEGVTCPTDDILRIVDNTIAGVLDVVEEQYTSIVTATAVDSQGDECGVDLSILPDLSTLFFETVNN